MSPSGQLCGLLAVDLSRHTLDHIKPYQLLFTINSCFKGVCLVLVAEVFGEVTAPPQRRVLVRHLNAQCRIAQVCVCVRMNVWALHAKDGGGTIESHHRCMDVCKRMRRSGACGYACLTMRPLTNHTHRDGTLSAFSSLWPGP